MSIIMEKRRSESSGLPAGWIREEIIRKTGLSAGKTDVYYFSPDGRKVRSKPQMARELAETLDMSAFDFRTGRMIHNALRKSKRPGDTVFDHARGVRQDAALALPIRQTASIFKQPVTVIRNLPQSKARTELKHGVQEGQPRQLFWEKRLHGLYAYDSSDEVLCSMELPKNIQGVGPELSAENVLQSISAALHLSTQPVIGQAANRASIQKNPGVNIDANQPHIQHTVVSDEDIRHQEKRVIGARKKLEEAIKPLA